MWGQVPLQPKRHIYKVYKRLTLEEVTIIKNTEIYHGTVTYLARRFNVRRQTIYDILQGKNYRYVTKGAS